MPPPPGYENLVLSPSDKVPCLRQVLLNIFNLLSIYFFKERLLGVSTAGRSKIDQRVPQQPGLHFKSISNINTPRNLRYNFHRGRGPYTQPGKLGYRTGGQGLGPARASQPHLPQSSGFRSEHQADLTTCGMLGSVSGKRCPSPWTLQNRDHTRKDSKGQRGQQIPVPWAASPAPWTASPAPWAASPPGGPQVPPPSPLTARRRHGAHPKLPKPA